MPKCGVAPGGLAGPGLIAAAPFRFYCDYCSAHLTHDSPAVRKTHNAGRRHKDSVREFFYNWVLEQGSLGYLPPVRPCWRVSRPGRGRANPRSGRRTMSAWSRRSAAC
jgi:hypothetical protein